MLIIPAIDLQDGCVVRLVEGRTDKKIYSRDPLKTAKHWVKQGAAMLHIVDLDGAFTGTPKNLAKVGEIVRNVPVPVEFGGGVRTTAAIGRVLGMGVERVVLGTRAVTDKTFLEKAFKKFKDKVIVSVDARDGKVAIEGWKNVSKGIDALKFAADLKESGFKEIIFTDTRKDGTLTGPNIAMLKRLLKGRGLKIIASGGISGLDDIYALKKLEGLGVSGIIIGKALYEGRFTLPEAIKIG